MIMIRQKIAMSQSDAVMVLDGTVCIPHVFSLSKEVEFPQCVYCYCCGLLC